MKTQLRRTFGNTLIVLALTVTSAACSSTSVTDPTTSSPAELTKHQADTLAAVRFRNSVAGIRRVAGTVVAADGSFRVVGWVDFASHRGAAVITPKRGIQPFLAVWDASGVAYLPYDGGSEPPARLPVGAWEASDLRPESGALAKGLLSLLLLGADRPENPLLLRQNGARYLGIDTVDRRPADHFSGVASPDTSKRRAAAAFSDQTQYWVAKDGLLVQFGTRLDSVRALSLFRLQNSNDAPKSLPIPADVTGGGSGQ